MIYLEIIKVCFFGTLTGIVCAFIIGMPISLVVSWVRAMDREKAGRATLFFGHCPDCHKVVPRGWGEWVPTRDYRNGLDTPAFYCGRCADARQLQDAVRTP